MRARIILFCLCILLVFVMAGIFIPQPMHIIETVDYGTLADIPPVVMPILSP